MLVDMDGKAIKPTTPLTREQMQFLVDSEIFWMGHGIALGLVCPKCRKEVEGDMRETEGKWTMTCPCSIRQYVGTDIIAPPVPPEIAPRVPLEDGSRRRETLTRYDRQMIANFETVVLQGLRMPYRLYCLRCRMTGQADGIWGKSADEQNGWSAECRCTIREYRDAGGFKTN